MFGFNCFEPMDVIEAFAPVTDKVIIVKDNNGQAYMPEFSFNGIGNLERNKGYQLKLTDLITDFQFCPFIVPLVEGCMEETAFNYLTSANMDDGSCFPTVLGCLDSTAFNFNDYDNDGNANVLLGIDGVDVNTSSGFCIPIVNGCTDLNAFNYDSNANTDDGSCKPLIYGCTDSTALNYDEISNTEDGTCIPIVNGCLDSLAYNYNQTANTDDGLVLKSFWVVWSPQLRIIIRKQIPN